MTDVTPAQPKSSLAGEIVLSLVWLIVVVVLCAPLAAWYFGAKYGTDGLVSVGLAAGICTVGGGLALFVRSRFADPTQAVIGTLAAMLTRMMFVLGWLMAFTALRLPLMQAGFPNALVLFFLVTLAAEAALSLRMLKQVQEQSPAENPGSESFSREPESA